MTQVGDREVGQTTETGTTYAQRAALLVQFETTKKPFSFHSLKQKREKQVLKARVMSSILGTYLGSTLISQ